MLVLPIHWPKSTGFCKGGRRLEGIVSMLALSKTKGTILSTTMNTTLN